MILIIDNASGLGKKTMFLPHLLKRLREMEQPYVTVQTPLGFRRALKRHKFIGCILTGSSTMLTNPLKFEQISPNVSALLQLDVPVLGICFGFQAITTAYGGELKRLAKFQRGPRRIQFDPTSILAKGVNTACVVEMYSDAIKCMPPGFKAFAWDSITGDVKGIEHAKSPQRIGVLFHPEFKSTNAEGEFILTRFIRLCKHNI
jgi:GMP synthase (glutamine-hydrolysing)